MSREKEDFRENLARLTERFPGREAITISETATILGRCPRTVLAEKAIPKIKISREYIVPLVDLARWLS